MFFHVLSCSFIFFHFLSFSFTFFHFLSLSFIFFHFLSFSFIFFHFLSFSFFVFVGCSNLIFLGLNFVTISLDSSYVKNQILGPSRVANFGPISGGTKNFGPWLFLFFPTFLPLPFFVVLLLFMFHFFSFFVHFFIF